MGIRLGDLADRAGTKVDAAFFMVPSSISVLDEDLLSKPDGSDGKMD
ncbi:MAG: hypothetical protein ACXV5I_08115 [Halobacteriota archaeon]